MSSVESEISFRDIVDILKEYYSEFIQSWLILLLFCLFATSVFFYRYYSAQETFVAERTFMVDDNESGGFSGMSSVLAQFGLGGGKNRSNLNKILAIAKSRRIIYESLLKSVELDGNTDLFGNHLLDIGQYRVAWSNPNYLGLKEYRFIDNNLDGEDLLRDRVLNILYIDLVEGSKSSSPIVRTHFDEVTSIMTIVTESISEEFALRFTDTLYSHLSHFYINNATVKAKSTYEVFKNKKDSIYQTLISKQAALANIRDLDQSSYLRNSRLKREKLIGELNALTQAYAESFKNTEIAAIDLEMKTPYITTIDRPRLPLLKNSPSLLKNILVGLFIGIFCGVVFIIIRKFLRDALHTDV